MILIMVGEFVVKQEGSKRRLIINFKGSNLTPDIAAYPQVMRNVLETLKANDADEIVLSEFYERIYDEKQTKMLREVADVIMKFETENLWSPSHLGVDNANHKVLQARHDAVLSVVNQTYVDPFAAYIQLLTFVKEAATASASAAEGSDEKKDASIFLGTLQFMRQLLEGTSLIAKSKQLLAQMGKMPEGRAIYHSIFESAIKPSFIGSRIFFTGTDTLELLDQYEVQGSKVYVYRHPDKIEYLYYINPPEYTLTPEKYFLLEKTKEIVAGHRPTNVGFMDMEQARKYFRKIYIATIADLAAKNNLNLSVEEKEELATIVSRYTIGYGILEIILADRQITDVYIDSPLGTKPIYLVHSKYGQCQTNIIFSEEEARATVSRFRALSGRPFDEAHPILDFDLADLQTRIAAIGKPLAVDGTAFALRLHKDTPWTLAQFLDFKMFTPITAGILSFFVDAQASMLIVGSRGSGKCLSPDALIHTPDGRLIPIQNFVEDELAKATEVTQIEDGVHAKAQNSFVYSMDENLKLNPIKVDRVWKRTAPKKMYKIKTRSGRTLTTTPEHPFFIVENGLVTHKQAKTLTLKEKIATARELKIETTNAKGETTIQKHKVIQEELLNSAEDVIPNTPLSNNTINRTTLQENISSIQASTSIKRQVEKLAFSDLFWDEISEIQEIKPNFPYVYDLTVEPYHSFVANGVIAHNTSLLQSMMQEIPQNLRIIVQEDTQELPIPQLKELGFNVQRLKTRPPLGAQSEAEVSAEDALRTALRLGDSVLIVGEVRSTECKALYEAMRVGAVGNVVMGTIHGESAYSIWDRVVNDLGVPTTSFKATDMCVVAAPIRFKGSLKRNRRLVEITEVGKDWSEDPGRENGFLNWAKFDAGKDTLELYKDDLVNSTWIKRVMKNRGLTYDEIWQEIATRAASKQYLVNKSHEFEIPNLLEAVNTIRAHNKLMNLAERQRDEFGGVDHTQLAKDWQNWVDAELIKEVVGIKKLSQ